MAKVQNPLFSVSATGQFMKTVVYAVWRGVAYARGYFIPTNANTANQQVIRDYFSTAVGAWQAETEPNKTLWTNYANTNSLSMSGFNLYVGEYIKFLHANSGTPPTVTNTPPNMS